MPTASIECPLMLSFKRDLDEKMFMSRFILFHAFAN